MRKKMAPRKNDYFEVNRFIPEIKEQLSVFHRNFINQYCFFDEIKYVINGNDKNEGLLFLVSLEKSSINEDTLRNVMERVIEDLLYDGFCVYLIECKSKKTKLVFEIPKELGGKRKFKKNRYFLKDFVQEKMNDYMLLMQQNKSTAYLKLHESYEEHCLAAERAFSEWGFVSSDSLPVSSFYVAYQRLKIEHTKALLRNYIVEQINRFLKSMKIDARIKLLETLSPLDIERKIEELYRGNLLIKDAAHIRC